MKVFCKKRFPICDNVAEFPPTEYICMSNLFVFIGKKCQYNLTILYKVFLFKKCYQRNNAFNIPSLIKDISFIYTYFNVMKLHIKEKMRYKYLMKASTLNVGKLLPGDKSSRSTTRKRYGIIMYGSNIFVGDSDISYRTPCHKNFT